MKKLIALILTGLLICLCAQAEETTYYTLNEDIYYHIHAGCGGAEGMVPISETAAAEFQKYLCPVCGPIKKDISAKSVVRGGTIVSRIPQTWLDDPKKTAQGVFADPSNTSHRGNEIHARLSELLHGQKYTDFMAEYDTNGRAEALVRVPDIIWEKGELIMNQRHFGDVYYIVFRPKNAFEDSYSTYVRFFEHDICLENDVLYETVGREWNDYDFNIALERIEGDKTVYSGGNESLKISVFREMDTNIAVITEKNADKNRISRVLFGIDGKDTGIEMSGYMDGKDAVYCCVLTDAELDLIKNGAEIHIPRADISEKADFEGTDYAIVKSGDFYGIVDRNHQFVLDAKYEDVERTIFDHIFVCSDAETYYKSIYDAAESRFIVQLDADDYGDSYWTDWPKVQNLAVFTLHSGQYNRIYDMKTGELISELGEYGSGNLSGVFAGPVYGDPDCLVSRKDDGMRLMDYQGNFRSGSYPRIIPLIWNGEEGLFLIANMENEYEISTDGHENAPEWRCGLIDQDGNVLAEMDYVRANIISGYAVSLTDAEGNAADFLLG